MSVITSLNKRAANLAQKALRLGGDFVHPVSDDSGNTPDYNDPNNIISPDGHIDLPHTVEWGEGFPSTTFLDPETGLLTTKTEGKPPLDEGTTIYDIYADRAERMGDEPLYTYKTNGEWVTKTGNEVLADIRQIAKGLMHYGLKKGDGVAFMCRTSYEWDVFDAAVMACGGVLATIYDTDSAEQIRNIVNNSDSRLLVVETTDMRAKADGADKECPALEHIICFENGGLDEIMAYGSGVSDEELDERIASIKKTDLCSIVYTSGSTAAPKGVEMTHEHYCTTALNLPAYMPKLLHERKNSVLLFLPQAHSFARAINYICVASELHIYIAQGIKTLIGSLPEEAVSDNVVDYIAEAIAAIGIGDYVKSSTMTTELAKKVDKVEGSRLMTNDEGTKLSGIAANATKVEKSNTNGNVKINGSEIVVYTLPGDVVRGSIASGSEVSEMLNEVFAAQVQE